MGRLYLLRATDQQLLFLGCFAAAAASAFFAFVFPITIIKIRIDIAREVGQLMTGAKVVAATLFGILFHI